MMKQIKKILLVNPRLNAWSPNIWVPLGLAYIAAVLEQGGYVVRIIDLNVRQLSKGKLIGEVGQADVVGIGGMITEYSEVLGLIDFVKKVDVKPVILGGGLATALPREILEVSQADFAVIGEGEKTIVGLLEAMENFGYGLADIRGIAYKSNGEIIINEPVEHIADLSSIPNPARHLLDMRRYVMDHFTNLGLTVRNFGKLRSTNLITSRGCPYSCNFCFKGMWGHKFRRRSPQNVVEEMVALSIDYNINGFFFLDDSFVSDKEWVLEFCKLLKERQLKVAWCCNGRVNLVTKELLEAMYDAGCRGVAYGIESGSQQVLDYIGKGITLLQSRLAVKWTKQAGMNATGFFMIGMLGETKVTITETIDFARELDLDFYGFSLVNPLIGTRLYNSVVDAGLVPRVTTSLGDWSLCVNANLTQDCTDAELAGFLSKAFLELYIKRRFGRYYFLNPHLLLGQIKLLLSMRNTKHIRTLIRKAIAIIKVSRE